MSGQSDTKVKNKELSVKSPIYTIDKYINDISKLKTKLNNMTNTKNQLETDIAVIKNTLETVQRDIKAILECNKENDYRITETEKKQVSLETRVGNLAFLQTGISLIIGTVAAFLGAKRW